MGLAPASIPLASSARNAPRRASSAPEDIVREPAGAGEDGETHERRALLAASRRPNRTRQARRPTVICPSCQGTGQYWNELLQELRPCPDCEGKGELPSVALERLVEEVRQTGGEVRNAYNRVYNRHNRS